MTVPELHVLDVGAGPAVVLLHGLTATHRYVVHGSRSLERSGHRVIAYDARGHGASGPADAYDYAALADDLLRVLDERGVERAVLAGASMGAHTLLRLALTEPGRVAGLVVITPAHHQDAERDLPRWDRLAEGLRRGGVEGFVAAYGDPAVPEQWRASVVQVLHQRLAQHERPEAVADALQQVPRSVPFDGTDALAELPHVPTLVVGDRDAADPGHPLWVAQAYAAAIPGAQLVVEDEGSSPIAWQGGQLSRRIAALVAEARS